MHGFQYTSAIFEKKKKVSVFGNVLLDFLIDQSFSSAKSSKSMEDIDAARGKTLRRQGRPLPPPMVDL